MKVSRVVRGAIALALLLGLVPMGAAQAAVNKPPRIKKAELKDKDGDGLADRIVLTYNERINHKLDTSRFPFRVEGYRILKVNGARRSLKLTILLKENENAPLKPASVKYSRTRKQPVKDLKKKQAAKQLLTRNITGLTATPPPPPPGPPAASPPRTTAAARTPGGGTTGGGCGIGGGLRRRDGAVLVDHGRRVGLASRVPRCRQVPGPTRGTRGFEGQAVPSCRARFRDHRRVWRSAR